MASVLRMTRLFISKNVLPNSANQVCVRNIYSKTTKEKDVVEVSKKPKPWPYQKKRYTILDYLYDKTTARLDENSKIIVVEGPIASGKSKFAKHLAEEFDMLYMPEANLDMLYINDYGFDLKTLDDQIPESCRSFDISDFLKNPKHRLTASFQIKQYSIKYSQYIDALAHVLSTGQGVILDRCVYSDFVFAEAMYSQKFISKKALSAYYDIRKNSIGELLRPHLIIYLDVPVEKVLQNVKSRNIPVEVKSPALTKEYLSAIEKGYKQKYLKEISTYSEIMVYDWSSGGDPEVVVEDIERIDFNRFDDQDPKLKDWVHQQEEQWGVLRHKYADKKDFLMTYLNVPRYDVPEFIIEAEDWKKYLDIWYSAPGMQYAPGYNKSLGDSGILFKSYLRHRETLPLRERRFP